jgi:hypothetical protein
MRDGEIEARLFEDGRPASGWHDSPAKCVAMKPRRRKASDDDGS